MRYGHQDQLILLPLFLVRIGVAEAAVSDLLITEFLASNEANLPDFEGAFPDWIEISNPGSSTVNLANVFLTDDETNPTKWQFPTSTNLAGNSFLIVYASNKAPPVLGTELHANFKLSAGGEYLALTNGSSVIFEYVPSFPAQTADVSYGIDSNGEMGYFSRPTPGQPNEERVVVTSDPVNFSLPRGFYSSSFQLELSPAVPSATHIFYTTNGDDPNDVAGSRVQYSTPIVIQSTTVIRATTNANPRVVTHTYIFLDSVLQQPAELVGFPDGVPIEVGQPFFFLRSKIPFDTEMDPIIVDEYRSELLEGLQAIPSMVLTGSPNDLFGPDGVYISDLDIERPVSMEIIDGAANEQTDAGVEGQSHNHQKKSLRLNFRNKYGNREWNSQLFQNSDVLSSDSVSPRRRKITLRAGNNRSWARNSNPGATCYCLDQMIRDTQIAMSGWGSHGIFVHLYINGAYWGVYNAVERPDDDFQSTYFGGDDKDWFYTNHGLAGSRNATRWDYLTRELISRDTSQPGNYAEMQEYVDVVAFADYILLHFYYGITDWPSNNWYVGNRNGVDPTPTRFFAWDAELSMDLKHKVSFPPGAHIHSVLRNRGCGWFNWRCNSLSKPVAEFADSSLRWWRLLPADDDEDWFIVFIWQALLRNRKFLKLFQERVDLHTTGVLSDETQIERWDALTTSIESAIIGESARWGDSLKLLGYRTRTRNEDWREQVDKIRSLLQGNKERLLTALRDASLYGAQTSSGWFA